MNERQYEQLRTNQRRRTRLCTRGEVPGIRPEKAALAAVLGDAAQALRRRAAAQRVWERIAQAAWLAGAEIAGVEGRKRDTLIIETRDSALHFELSRRREALEQEFSRRVPGLRQVRLVVNAGREPEAG